MKKIIKSTSLFIIAIVCIFGFRLEVNAAGQCGDLDYSRCRVGERGVIKVAGNGYVYQKLTASTVSKWSSNKLYYSSAGISNNFGGAWFNSYWDSYSALFCLDAQFEGYQTLYAERFLLDPKEDVYTQVFDAGVMSILMAGKGTGSAADYFARLQAIRGLTYTFGYYKSSNIKYAGAYYAGLSITSNWNKNNAGVINELNSALNAAGAGSVKSVSPAKYTYGGTPVANAEKYYVAALQAATEYAKKLATTPKVTQGSITAGEIETTGEKGNEFVQKDVVHTIKLSGFSKEHKFVINPNNKGIKFAEGTQYTGLTAYISKIDFGGKVVEGEDAVGAILGQNLVELGYIPENQDIEIKITAHFEGWKSSTDKSKEVLKCGQQPIKYSIDGIYDTGVSEEFSEYVATVWYSGAANAQRFVGIEKLTEKNEGDGTPWESPYETNLIEACTCENLKEACIESGSPSSSECNELKEANCGCDYLDAMCQFGDEASCEKYETECETNCNTEFTPLGACCDNANNLVISTSDEEMDPYEIHGNKKDEIKACFVTKVDNGAQPVDENNNSYKMLTDSSVANNRFCSVNCREDYTMQLPSAKRVNAGRYFTFKTSIKAEKQCFTNTINKEKFEQEMEAAEKNIIDATNTYLRWKKAYENRTNYKYTQGTYHPSCGTDVPFDNGVYIQETGDAWTYPKFIDQFYKFNSQLAQPTTQSVYEYEGAIGTTVTGNGTCPDYTLVNGNLVQTGSHQETFTKKDDSPTISELEKKLTDKITQAWESVKDGAAIKAAVEAYAQLIRDYNDCSLWESEYKYDPEVTYDYEEEKYSTMAGMPIEMNEITKNISSATYEYCQQQGPGKGPTIVDPEYENCSTGFKGSNDYFESEAVYTICELKSPGGVPECKRDDQLSRYRVTKARYKKYSQKADSSYVPQNLFYNIYPSGEISVESGDDRVLLEEKLPVALGRRLGIYEYYVNYTNVGEFYNNGEQGRFIGQNGIIENSEYVCAYLVNIPEQEFYCDAIGCEGPDCTVDCIGPNCEDLDCDGTDCIADCIGVGCVYDDDAGSSIIEKTVSLNNLFPYGTNSYNWDISHNSKAAETVLNIEEKGNSVYDEVPILSITLTPSSTREIKKYNNDVLDDGGYSNKTVACQNRNGFEQVVCYSSFIDDLLSGAFGDVVNENSLIIEEGYRHGDNSEYFTLWPNGTSENDMIGPSWK